MPPVPTSASKQNTTSDGPLYPTQLMASEVTLMFKQQFLLCIMWASGFLIARHFHPGKTEVRLCSVPNKLLYLPSLCTYSVQQPPMLPYRTAFPQRQPSLSSTSVIVSALHPTVTTWNGTTNVLSRSTIKQMVDLLFSYS